MVLNMNERTRPMTAQSSHYLLALGFALPFSQDARHRARWAVAGSPSHSSNQALWLFPCSRGCATKRRSGFARVRSRRVSSGRTSALFRVVAGEALAGAPLGTVAVRKTESRCCSGPVRVLHRCCSGTKRWPSVHLSTRQSHFGPVHRCCSGTPI